MERPIEYTEGVDRFEDMSPGGSIHIHRQLDGDVVLTVHGIDMTNRPTFASIEFCTGPGGGQSHHTMMALIVLIEAIKKDNKERPQYRDGDS